MLGGPAVAEIRSTGCPHQPKLAGGGTYMVIFPVYIAYMLSKFGIARRGAACATSFGARAGDRRILSALNYDETFGRANSLGAALVSVVCSSSAIRSALAGTGARRRKDRALAFAPIGDSSREYPHNGRDIFRNQQPANL